MEIMLWMENENWALLLFSLWFFYVWEVETELKRFSLKMSFYLFSYADFVIWWIHTLLRSSPCISLYKDHFSHYLQPYVTQVKFLPLRESVFQKLTKLCLNEILWVIKDLSIFYSDAYEKNIAFFSIITSHLTVIICLHISLAVNFKTPEYSV